MSRQPPRSPDTSAPDTSAPETSAPETSAPAGADVFARLREEYPGAPLREDTLLADPVDQFRRWFDEVVALPVPMANGMTLATVDDDGQPTARTVLLKSFDERGFVFYTNYQSRKAAAVRAHPRAALLFWWHPAKRQVRIEGIVERVSDSQSDEYFLTRPRESNLSAMASPQSQVVEGRAWLVERVERTRREWADRPLVRPAHWGGYRLVPRRVEFWQGRPDRLHDRLCYIKDSSNRWRIERLAP